MLCSDEIVVTICTSKGYRKGAGDPLSGVVQDLVVCTVARGSYRSTLQDRPTPERETPTGIWRPGNTLDNLVGLLQIPTHENRRTDMITYYLILML